MKIFLLLITIIYLLPEVYSFKLLIKSKASINEIQLKRIVEIERQMTNFYSKDIKNMTNSIPLLIMFYYILYIIFAISIIKSDWFLLISLILTIITIINYLIINDTINDTNKMKQYITNKHYILLERVKLILTTGYGLSVIILTLKG